VSAITEMVALRVSQATEHHSAVERKCSKNRSGRAESWARAEAGGRLLRIKVSLSAGVQVKNNGVRSRENDVAQAAYAFTARLMLDRVEITLSRYVLFRLFEWFGLRRSCFRSILIPIIKHSAVWLQELR